MSDDRINRNPSGREEGPLSELIGLLLLLCYLAVLIVAFVCILTIDEFFPALLWLVPVVALAWFLTRRLKSGPIRDAFLQVIFNVLIGLLLVCLAILYLNFYQTEPESVGFAEEWVEREFFMFKSCTTIGLILGILLVFALSLLQVRIKQKWPLGTYKLATGIVSRLCFVLAVFTSFTVGVYHPCSKYMSEQNDRALVEREDLAIRVYTARIKRAVTEAMEKSQQPVQWVQYFSKETSVATNSDSNSLARVYPISPDVDQLARFEVLGPYHIEDVSQPRFLAQDYGKVLARKIAVQLKSISTPRAALVVRNTMELPTTKALWEAQKTQLRKEKEEADHDEADAQPALETLKQIVGAAVPEAGSEIVNAIIETVVDGVSEQVYLKMGQVPDTAYAKLVNLFSKKLDMITPGRANTTEPSDVSGALDLKAAFAEAEKTFNGRVAEQDAKVARILVIEGGGIDLTDPKQHEDENARIQREIRDVRVR